ncbi:chitinase-3-like protein 1 [Quillaja saponaria]|uniref:Chitinase-3-like protein 1 n=1 Tax=Quillaja saponaria TaxID=32244 RepID=A0AAD7LY48_QUISA|nr:chitinase-3-like protein 1 [Quillaja saponaria]
MATKNFIPLCILLIYQTVAESSNLQPSNPSDWSPSISSIPYPSSLHGIQAAYWPSFNEISPSSIDTKYFTHILYAFLLPEIGTYKLDITPIDQTKISEFVDALRTRNPPVKTLLSIGGGGSDPAVFSNMASTKHTREIFINSTVEVARKFGFDGVDLDWEFPANDQDMSNLALLFKEWSIALHNEAKINRRSRLLLTAAVYYASKFTVYGGLRSYPARAINKYMDWVSPMCFDYHGSWENFTGVNAALYDPKSNISTNYGIRSWIQAGVPPEKLVMGLPLYGRTWKLKDPNVNGIGAPAVGVGPGDGSSGTMDYYQILDFNNGTRATVVFDRLSVSYYSYVGDSWIGYDDVRSIQKKIRFARTWGLRGYFFWALGKDKDWTLSIQASNTWRHQWP